MLGSRSGRVWRGTETSQQGKYRKSNNAKDSNFSKRVESAEINQNDVDDVLAAAARIGVLEEIVADAAGRYARHHRIGDDGHPCPAAYGEQQVTIAADTRPDLYWKWIGIFPTFRKPAEPEQQQNGGDDLDQQLCHRKIGRGKPDESDAGYKACPAEKDQCRQPMELRLIGGADGAGSAEYPKSGKDRIHRLCAERTRLQAGGENRPGGCKDSDRHHDTELRLQTARTEEGFRLTRPIPRQGHQDALENALPLQVPEKRRTVLTGCEIILQHPVQKYAADHGDDTHHQRQVETVPDRETIFWRCLVQHRQYSRMQEWPDGQAWNDADQQAKKNEKFDRTAHPVRRLVRLMRQIMRRRPEERRIDEAHRIGDGEDTRNRGHVRRYRIKPRDHMGFHRLCEEHFLGNEPVKQGHASHGRARHHGERRRIGHGAQKPAQPAHVARAGLMIDDTGGHEKRYLEDRMVE